MRARLLRRRRISTLLEGMFEVPLFIVVASVGYGKTTAVRDFLISNSRCRYVWFSLRANENDGQWTWQRFCQSLSQLDEECVRRLAEYGLPRDSVDLDRVFSILSEMVTERTVLVVDDYHENKSESLDSFFTALANAAIPHLHAVLISRTYPRIPTDELILKGLCGELTQANLEFTGNETASFFALNGFELDSWEQATVNRITDGWTAAIYLTLLKYAEDGAIESTRGITRLVRTAVFDKLDVDTQRILLQLSLLDGFTIPGAVFVTGDRRAGDVIRGLADNNCFVKCEPTSGTYELHSILRAALSEVFPASSVDTTALLIRCGDWSQKCGELIQAVDFYRKAGAHEKILDVFRLPGAGGLIDKAPEIIIGAFSEIDLSLKLSRPLGYIAYIYGHLVAVDLTEGAKMLLEAKAHYEADPDLVDKQHILGEIAYVESFLQFNDARRMVLYHKKAYSLLREGRSEIAKAEGIFTFGSPHTLYLYHKEPGRLSELVDLLESEGPYFTHMANGCGAGFEHLARAEYCLETGDLINAEILARKAILKAKSRDQVSLIVCGTLCLARLLILSKQPGRAVAALDEVRPLVEFAGIQVLIDSLDMAVGYVNGVLGDLSGIPEWLRDPSQARSDIYYQGMGINYLIAAKAALLNSQYAELEAIVETIRGLCEPNNHLFGFIHAGIYDAVAKWHLYDSERAVEALRQAIELAEKDGIVTPFAESSPELGPILIEAWKRADGAWMRKVMTMSERIAGCRAMLGEKPRMQSLTPREVEVLILLEQGLKQEEIALRLHVSPNTVSRHLQNLYGKLGVHNKTQALNRARALRLV